ncbi:MAG: nucleoside hydrolase [Candidatus Limivicinus sp.]
MSKEKLIPVILDGDPGHDDAIAWMLAKASGRMDIRAVTACAGNQTIEKTSYNAMRVCTLLGIDAPVAMGLPHGLLGDPVAAPSVHGNSGLDGPALPEPAMALSPLGAVELMAEVLREAEGPVSIISTGPQTNVAALLLAHPELKSKIGCISLMGGGVQHGNWTPAAEFNILTDPEAAETVFNSGIEIFMAGLDVTEKALIYPEDFARIRAAGNQVSQVVADWLEFFYRFHKSLGYPGAPLHDPCAVAVLLRPEIFTVEDLKIEIETAGEYCRGATVADTRNTDPVKANAHCLMNVDRAAFADMLLEAVKRFDGREVEL